MTDVYKDEGPKLSYLFDRVPGVDSLPWRCIASTSSLPQQALMAKR